MEQYCYLFTWGSQTKYIYAPSLVDAKKDFKETFKLDPDDNKNDITIVRQEPGFSRKFDPFA